MSDKKKKAGETGTRDPGPGELSYSEASAELERILQDIESGEIDLDELSAKVERAAALLAICRGKLAATETKVRQVVADLAKGGDDDDARGADKED